MNDFYPSEREFIRLAKRGNLIPIYTELPADLETPVSAYMKSSHEKYSFLLESVEGGEHLARYSFLGSSPSLIFKSSGNEIEITEHGKKCTFRLTKGDPLKEIQKIMSCFRFVPVPGLPRFCGGLVGYVGYDMVRFFEHIPDNNENPLCVPDAVFLLTDSLIIFDHSMQKIKIVVNAATGDSRSREALVGIYRTSVQRIKKLSRRFSGNCKGYKTAAHRKGHLTKRPRITSHVTKKVFMENVRKAKRYIRNGDIVQTVLSQRFSMPIHSDRLTIYRALRSINPSPYMFYLQLDDMALIGSSPEIFVRCEEGKIELRPIAGTRPRGLNEKEDRALEKELLADPKERAEHVMLVDLGRNDIGRVSRYGSVTVPECMVIERYSHVMHIVSGCVGTLKKNKDIYDLIRATFPAGTVSGAPKIRAMEIIDELENVRRGPYAGFVGYLSFSGNLDSCITIRTILIKGRRAYIQAGAGIVADSRPEREYVETVNKAGALIEALKLAHTL
ncbi:MAG: anthranilate synthase component I [Candidatus Omnitrophica bacterium]|nr:anthranilate synthase component I [Candidatus Omnitrophota bacterium]